MLPQTPALQLVSDALEDSHCFTSLTELDSAYNCFQTDVPIELTDSVWNDEIPY